MSYFHLNRLNIDPAFDSISNIHMFVNIIF